MHHTSNSNTSLYLQGIARKTYRVNIFTSSEATFLLITRVYSKPPTFDSVLNNLETIFRESKEIDDVR